MPSTPPPLIYADYGDAVLHRFGWYAPSSSSPLQVAAPGALGRASPREYGQHVRPGTVPNEPIREAFERSGMTLSELCRNLGYVRRDDKGYLVADTSLLSRKLGLQHYGRSRVGTLKRQSNVKVDVAARIVRALHLDPVDFGL